MVGRGVGAGVGRSWRGAQSPKCRRAPLREAASAPPTAAAAAAIRNRRHPLLPLRNPKPPTISHTASRHSSLPDDSLTYFIGLGHMSHPLPQAAST